MFLLKMLKNLFYEPLNFFHYAFGTLALAGRERALKFVRLSLFVYSLCVVVSLVSAFWGKGFVFTAAILYSLFYLPGFLLIFVLQRALSTADFVETKNFSQDLEYEEDVEDGYDIIIDDEYLKETGSNSGLNFLAPTLATAVVASSLDSDDLLLDGDADEDLLTPIVDDEFVEDLSKYDFSVSDEDDIILDLPEDYEVFKDDEILDDDDLEPSEDLFSALVNMEKESKEEEKEEKKESLLDFEVNTDLTEDLLSIFSNNFSFSNKEEVFKQSNGISVEEYNKRFEETVKVSSAPQEVLSMPSEISSAKRRLLSNRAVFSYAM